MNRDFLDANPGDSTLAARVRSYELAARMQMSIPEVDRLRRAKRDATKQLYGLDDAGRRRASAATACWRGGCWSAACASCSSINGGAFGSPRINWDAHEDIVDNHTQAGGDHGSSPSPDC